MSLLSVTGVKPLKNQPCMTDTRKFITLKAYSPGEIAKIYEVDRRTMNKWLKPFKEEIGLRLGRYYTIAQVRIIFLKLSVPGIVITEE
jgi:hypothetical protein